MKTIEKITFHICLRLMARFPRYRLYRICKALGIRPYKWQWRYAITGDKKIIPLAVLEKRKSGKTTAIMLRLLLVSTANDMVTEARVHKTLYDDPDFWTADQKRRAYYYKFFIHCAIVCAGDGIEIIPIRWPFFC